MNPEHMFRKIKTTFNLFATLRVNLEKLTDRESLLLSKDSFHLGSYKKLHRGKRKTNPRKKTTAGQKRKRRRSIKIAWEMQLINWRIIVRYWPRPIIPSFSLRLGSVCALPGCLTAAPSSESRRTVRLIESNHPRNDIKFSCAPSYVSRVLDRETRRLGSVVKAQLCDSHDSRRGVEYRYQETGRLLKA